MNIPTYKANVGQYNVPSMNAASELNNANMVYEGVAKVCDTITKAGIAYYEREKKEQAKKAGAEYIAKSVSEKGASNTSLMGLPDPNTAGQEAFNAAAIKHYSHALNSETEIELNNLSLKHKDNAAAFATEADSYIGGISSNIPTHLQPDILGSIRIKKQAIYSKILNEQAARNLQIMKAQSKFSMYNKKDTLANLDWTTDNEKIALSNSVKFAEYVDLVESNVGHNITADDGIKMIEGAKNDIAFSFISSSIRKLKGDSKAINEFLESVVAGTTKNEFVNNMSVEDRYKAKSMAVGEVVKIREEQVKLRDEIRASSRDELDEKMVEFTNKSINNQFEDADDLALFVKDMHSLAQTPEDKDRLKNFLSTEQIVTPKAVISECDRMLDEGTLTFEHINEYKALGIMGSSKYNEYANILNTPLEINKKKKAWIDVMAQLEYIAPKNSMMDGVNPSREYIKSYMKSNGSKDLLDEGEIYELFNTAVEKARRIPKGVVNNADFGDKKQDSLLVDNKTLNKLVVNEAKYDKNTDTVIVNEQNIRNRFEIMFPSMDKKELNVEISKIISFVKKEARMRFENNQGEQ